MFLNCFNIYFRPELCSEKNVSIQSRAKFSIRSGFQQTSSYFNDVESVNFEVLHGHNSSHVAFVNVSSFKKSISL